jgi:hypothetical protein
MNPQWTIYVCEGGCGSIDLAPFTYCQKCGRDVESRRVDVMAAGDYHSTMYRLRQAERERDSLRAQLNAAQNDESPAEARLSGA